jgi:tRNA nucleotidyltransferase (CCA-adding enzyme)
MTEPQMYLVGGAVRDKLLGLRPHDFDFTVVADSFEAMKEFLVREFSVEIFLETPQFVTIRGRFPKGQALEWGGFDMTGQACDFVLARKEGVYTDGRRPDTTEPGTLLDDLARRDFTVNAMAMDSKGVIIDPHHGFEHVFPKQLIAVGDAGNRMYEDPLRVLRAIRFAVVKGFTISTELSYAMETERVLTRMKIATSVERVRVELEQCFRFDTLKTLRTLDKFPSIRNYIFEETNLWLKPTLEER